MKKFTALIALCLIAINSVSLFAEDIRMEPYPFYREASTWPEPYSPEQLILAALHASGVSDKEIDNYQKKIFTELELFGSTLDVTLSDYEKGEYLLDYLHRRILKEYDFSQTRLDVLIDTGLYNCVSSGLLFMIFGRYIGLDVGAVYAVDHAFCFIRTEKGSVDVETTNPYGFEPGTKKEFTDSFTGKTGFTYVPPHNYRLRGPIGDREMIGFVLQNRIASDQRRGDYADALSLSIDRWTLTGSPKGYEDFLVTVRNLGVHYNGEKQYRKGLEQLKKVDDFYSIAAAAELKEIFSVLGNNGLIVLLNGDDIEGSYEFLGFLSGLGFYSEEELQKFSRQIEGKRIELLVKNENYDKALPGVNESYNGGLIDFKTWKAAVLFLINREAETISSRSGYLEAFMFLDELQDNIQQLKEIAELKNVYLHNYAVTVHNEFVPLYNGRKYDEAVEIIKKGLKNAPNDSLLLKDKSLLEKQGIRL